nr:IucA/IucC family protein [Streptomyces albus]
MDPVRTRPARRLIGPTEPMVPPQERRTGRHEDLPDGPPDSGRTGHTGGPARVVAAPRARTAPYDPLHHPDSGKAADAAASENLLRCWVRETGLACPPDGTLRVPLPASGTALLVPVRHWSVVGWHRFDPPYLKGAPPNAAPLEAVALAALIGREAAHGAGDVTEPGGADSPEGRSGTEAPGRPDERDGRETGGRPGDRGAPEAGEGGGDGGLRAAAGAAAAGVTDSGVAPSGAAASGAALSEADAAGAPVSGAVASGSIAPGAVAPGRVAPGAVARETARAQDSADLVGRVADSVRRTARFLADRREHPEPPPGTCPFLDGEQALLFGHPLHPTPKSREGLTETEENLYSPEVRAGFPLHWMAVHRTVLAGDSAWTDRGKPVSAPELAVRLSGRALVGRLPDDCVPLPLHPWQAGELRHSPAVRGLLEAGLLHDLGQTGECWHPTSSVRTVFRPDSSAMLKLSLGLRITNSRRENLRKELLRGLEVHRLLRGELGAAWRAAHPCFDIVRDPAWLGVDVPGEGRVPGFDTVIRHNPFGAGEDAVCLAGLTAPVPVPNGSAGVLRSRLASLVTALAQRTRRPLTAVAAEWFLRYLDAVVRPILWLDAHAGIALEAHQQNTLVLLDAHGWPQGGRYRDNQGYYFRASHREALSRRLPGTALGVASDTFVADGVTDERFAYYLGINNVLGLIGAFGSQRLADERVLLAAFRRFLADAARDRPASPLPALLLESPTLRCKANLLTRLHGLDELVGPVDTQSVYITLDNPIIP